MYYSEIRSQMNELKQQLRDVGSAANLDAESAREYDIIKEEMKMIQNDCSHYFEKQVVFTSVKSMCRYCDKVENSQP